MRHATLICRMQQAFYGVLYSIIPFTTSSARYGRRSARLTYRPSDSSLRLLLVAVIACGASL